MVDQEKTVFISYRRDVSAFVARSIFMDLREHGYDVFMDVESLDSGTFDTIILNQIAARAHFLVILAPRSVERFDEPGDWLRREIEHAIDLNRNVVPVLVNDFKFGNYTRHFTGRLSDLPRYNALTVPHDFFDAAMEKLRTRFLRKPVAVTIQPTPSSEQPVIERKIEEVTHMPAPTETQLKAELAFEKEIKTDPQPFDYKGIEGLAERRLEAMKGKRQLRQHRSPAQSQQSRIPKIITPTQPFEPELILIPAGEFLMGSDPKKDKIFVEAKKTYKDNKVITAALNSEQPQHSIYLPDYYMAKTPVTNAQYAAFVQATGHQAPYRKENWAKPYNWDGKKPPTDKENHPVVLVSWDDAVAYCQWLTKTSTRTYRLPTEAEWEKAARGSKGWIYPWGNQWDQRLSNTSEGGPGDTTPVGAYPDGASPYGLLDMAGNVWEWTATKWQKSYPYDVKEDEWSASYLQEGSDVRVLRGGSWRNSRSLARCAGRFGFNIRNWYFNYGLRLVSPI